METSEPGLQKKESCMKSPLLLHKMIALKSTSFSALKTEAQKVFNAWILRRDKDAVCIYCNHKSFGKGLYNAEAAHFLPVSTAESLRYNPLNAHKAHQGCNQEDNREAYRENLIVRVGLDNVLMLESQHHSLAKFSRFEIEEVISVYRNKPTTV